MALVGIEEVTYGVDDLDTVDKFFSDFGLETVDRARSGATFGTPESTMIHVRPATDSDLPGALEPGSTLREVIWGVDSKESLDAIEANLSTDRTVTRDANNVLHTVDETGYGIGFRVSTQTPVHLEPLTFNTIGATVRHNERFKLYERAAPQHIGHVVIYAPNFDEAFAFYTQRLGFMVSDTLRDLDSAQGFGAFLRCSTDHHNLFLIRHNRTGFNHLSFGVHGIDEIMGGFTFLSKQGWTPAWGLGRHFIGSNIFYYFRNPAGGYVEYYADMDCILDPASWKPGEFPHNTPEALFAWGGAPPKEFLE